MYKNLKEKQKIVIDFIKKHKDATTREIKIKTGVKVEKAFFKGIKEAFKLANLPLPNHLLKRDETFCKKLVIEFIRKNPNTTVSEIQEKLHINLPRLFNTIEKAFISAGVLYPRKNKFDVRKKRQELIRLIKNDPLITPNEISIKTGINVYSVFKNLQEVYKLVGIEYIGFREKRKLRKQREIISYIKRFPKTTQWEINRICRTHVQDIFKGGIRKAFEKARVTYPEIERILYGTAKKSIKRRSLIFQNRVISILKQFGKVRQQVKIKNGVVDAILELDNEVIPIEIKDYRTKPISNIQ